MKTLMIVLAAAATMLGGCETYGYDTYGYNAYYDGFYGPYYDGYWGRDSYFWYESGAHGPFVRDGSHHFHHAPGNNLHGVHASRSPVHRH
jgi:hypothetical protein